MELRPELEQILYQLKNNTPKTLLSDDALLEDNWNNVCASIKLLTDAIKTIKELPPDIPLPGFPYFRCPGMPVPWEKYSQTIKSQWEAVHALYPGDFMRLAGGNASKFKESGTSIYHDSGIKGDGGGQIDTMQSHTHDYEDSNASSHIAGTAGASSTTYTQYMYREQKTDKKTKPNNGRTGDENRPANVTIELYIFKG